MITEAGTQEDKCMHFQNTLKENVNLVAAWVDVKYNRKKKGWIKVARCSHDVNQHMKTVFLHCDTWLLSSKIVKHPGCVVYCPPPQDLSRCTVRVQIKHMSLGLIRSNSIYLFFFFTKACTYFLTSTIQSPYRGLPILVWRWGTEWADSRAYDFHCRVQLVCSIWPLVFGEDAQHHYQKLALKHAWCHWGSIITAWRWFCVGLGEFPCFLLLEATTCIHMLIDHNVFIICENLILN